MASVFPPGSEVSSAEISRNFGVWQDKAMLGPVIVTKHGRPRVVLLSAESYAPDFCSSSADPQDQLNRLERSLSAVLNHMVEGFVALDPDLNIVDVNRAFESLVDSSKAHLVGRPLEEAFPRAQPIFRDFLKRVLKLGEEAEFEMPSAVAPGRLYKIRAFPYLGGVAAVVQSRQAEYEEEKKHEALSAQIQSFNAIPGLCSATINLRGVFKAASQGFINLTGLSEQDLSEVQVLQILKSGSKADVTRAIEHCIEQRQTVSLETMVLSRGLSETPVQMALSPIFEHGAVCAVSLVAAVSGK